MPLQQMVDYKLDVATPFEQALQGVQLGSTLGGIIDQRQQAEAAAKAKAEEQADLAALSAKVQAGIATAADFTGMATRRPGLTKQMTEAWGMLEPAQRETRLSNMSRVMGALKSGQTDIAQSIIAEQATAMRNAGDEKGAAAAEAWGKTIGINPQAAYGTTALLLGAIPGGDKVLSSLETVGKERRADAAEDREAAMAPAKLTEAQAKAEKARVESKLYESGALLDLEKKRWDIKKTAAGIDIDKENARIAAINAATSRETNALKRQELLLKLQDAQAARDEKIRTKVADVESGRASIDAALNTMDQIMLTPEDVRTRVHGGLDQYTPTLRPDSVNYKALTNTLKSQVFMAQVEKMRGLGALGEKEGAKLESSLVALDTAQTDAAYQAALKEAQRLLMKARSNLATKYGVPDTTPDRPNAAIPTVPGPQAPSGAEIDALVSQYTAQ